MTIWNPPTKFAGIIYQKLNGSNKTLRQKLPEGFFGITNALSKANLEGSSKSLPRKALFALAPDLAEGVR